jgi:hypothetical protein
MTGKAVSWPAIAIFDGAPERPGRSGQPGGTWPNDHKGYDVNTTIFAVTALIGMRGVVKPTGKVVVFVWSTEEKNPCRGVALAILRCFGGDFSTVPDYA